FTAGCQPAPAPSGASEASAAAPQGAGTPTPEAEASAAPHAVSDGSADAAAVPTSPTAAMPATTPEGAPVLPAVTTPREAQTGDNATRCARLVTLLLEDLNRMLTYMGGTPEQFAFLAERIRPFHERAMADRCVSASPDVLTCIETADNAFTGLARCGINAGKPFEDRLLLRPVIFDVPWEQPQAQVTDPVGAQQLRDALVGQWHRDERDTWTFDANGTARHVDAVVDETFTVVTTSASRLMLTPMGADGQPAGSPAYWSAATDGQTLYVTPLPDNGAVAMSDTPFVVVASGYWLLWDLSGTPRCTGFYSTGQPVHSARCAWRDDPDRRRLQLVVNLGHDPQTGEPASDAPLNLITLGGQLVPENSFKLFTRVAEGSGDTP
ncbi:MAG: hypothetical protein KGO50_18090, partial [Myxococcales bacterium]|nr:hypothetical protein [Myxococcales bacterium]